jgi:sulfur carrier protein ThiS
MADLLQHLEISLHPEDLLLVVNGRTAPIDQALQGDDQVNLIPAISGG